MRGILWFVILLYLLAKWMWILAGILLIGITVKIVIKPFFQTGIGRGFRGDRD